MTSCRQVRWISKPTSAPCRTTNWSSYNASLRKQGSLPIRVDEDMTSCAPRDGRPAVFSVPGHTILPVGRGPVQTAAPSDCRDGGEPAEAGGAGLARAGLLDAVPQARDPGRAGSPSPLRWSAEPAVDSTGIRFLGDGEWQARKHGAQGRRQWRKVHLGVDTVTSDIRAVEITPSRDGDGPILPDLLDQVPMGEPVGTVTADGAYDPPLSDRNPGARRHSSVPDPQERATREG